MSRQEYNDFIDLIVEKNGKPQYDFNHKRMNRIEGYHIHHIVPKSLGGTDDPSNLVYMLTNEHLHAHKLLSEFGGPKMKYAYNMMKNIDYSKYDHFKTPEARKHRSERAKKQHSAMSEEQKKERGANISKGYERWSDDKRKQFGADISKRKKKSVKGVCISTGNVLHFESGKETAKMGFRPSKVSECCNKKIDSHMGYIWSFEEQ